MKIMKVREIVKALNAKLIQGNEGIECSRVSTDTRSLNPGDLFFALVGENFDAHNFLDKAVTAGAGALVLSRAVPGLNSDLPVILVEDTLKALQQLAGYNRRLFNIPVVGITGSNGKTTTKDMVAVVLEQNGRTLKTKANFNNEIGMPMTLLELDETYDAAVVEMGMRGLGEIDLLAGLAQPSAAIITNIGETHLERLGSIENIAKAKSEILAHLDPEGFALLNGDNEWVRKVGAAYRGKKLFYGLLPENDYQAENIEMSSKGVTFTVNSGKIKEEVFIPVLGRHNVINAVAAVAIGLEFGLTIEQIKKGLAQISLTGMRLEVVETPRCKIINDAYNANPASTKEALQVLKEIAGTQARKIAVLGNMFELGEREEAGHFEVGEAAASIGVSELFAVGDLALQIAKGAEFGGMPLAQIHPCKNNIECIEILKQITQPGDVILVKGSRGMKMEEIVKALSIRDSL